jgi:phytoene desaturase
MPYDWDAWGKRWRVRVAHSADNGANGNGTGGARAVVIGAGFGGLAAAVRLWAKGYAVTLLEAGDQPGGRAAVFERDGFSFDAGPTVITAPYLIEELFVLAGRNPRDYFDLVPVDPFYRIEFDDGTHFDYVGEEDRLLKQIERIEPRDVAGYRRLAAHAERIFNKGYTELADVPFPTVGSMLRVLPAMVRLESYRSVYGLVAKYLKSEKLRRVFSLQSLLVGGNPFTTTSIYMLIHWLERKWGVHYALGGTTSIIKGLWKLLGELGVDLRLNAPVAEIEAAGGRVVAARTEAGERFPCDVVVSNADPSMVYSKLIAPAHRRGRHSDRAIRRMSQSMSLFVAYFGTRKLYPEIAHHTIILGKRYRSLLADIFRHKKLADDFSLYLHAPTRSDPSVAPEGCESFYVLSPVPNQRSGIDWEQMHETYLDRILDFLDAKYLPGLRENLVTAFAVDPRYFADRLRSYDGAAFGIEPSLRQSAYFRYHNESPDLKGLYFVGAGTHPGAGVPGVLSSAKVLERLIGPVGSPQPAAAVPV